jgi:hypothetical protein
VPERHQNDEFQAPTRALFADDDRDRHRHPAVLGSMALPTPLSTRANLTATPIDTLAANRKRSAADDHD